MSDDKSELLRSLTLGPETAVGAKQASGGWKVPALVAAICLAVGGAVGWLAKPQPKPQPAPTPAVAATTAPARISGLTASGYVVARSRATVAAEVTGRVVEVRVEEGQVVRKGDVLAVLDASIAQADNATSMARKISAEASVAAAQAQFAEARQALTRAQSLARSGYVSEAVLQAATARSESSKAQLDLSRAQLEAARSDANRSGLQLSRYVIRAPFSGVVIDKAAQAGEIISPLSAGGGFTRTGICTLVDMESLEIEVDVNEAYIGRVAAGQKVEAVLDAYPESRLPARVIATIPAASRDKATVRVRIAFEGRDPRIIPDMAVKVTFIEPTT